MTFLWRVKSKNTENILVLLINVLFKVLWEAAIIENKKKILIKNLLFGYHLKSIYVLDFKLLHTYTVIIQVIS